MKMEEEIGKLPIHHGHHIQTRKVENVRGSRHDHRDDHDHVHVHVHGDDIQQGRMLE